MGKRAEKESRIEYVRCTYYRKFWSDDYNTYLSDYTSCIDSYFKNIERTEDNILKFNRLWKRDIFDTDRIRYYKGIYIFEDLISEYGNACTDRLITEIIDDLCYNVFNSSEQ